MKTFIVELYHMSVPKQRKSQQFIPHISLHTIFVYVKFGKSFRFF